MEQLYKFISVAWSIVGLAVPILILALYARRRTQKRRYYANDDTNAPIEGTLEELNAVDPTASPWLNDQRRKLLDTMELVGRFNTIDGYSKEYVDDLLARLRAQRIDCETLFQETMPMGVAASIVAPIGTYEVFADREKFNEASRVISDFKRLT